MHLTIAFSTSFGRTCGFLAFENWRVAAKLHLVRDARLHSVRVRIQPDTRGSRSPRVSMAKVRLEIWPVVPPIFITPSPAEPTDCTALFTRVCRYLNSTLGFWMGFFKSTSGCRDSNICITTISTFSSTLPAVFHFFPLFPRNFHIFCHRPRFSPQICQIQTCLRSLFPSSLVISQVLY